MPAARLPIVAAVISSALLAASPAAAQREDSQIWEQTNINVGIAPGARVTFEQIARFSDRQSGLYQTEHGAILGLRIARGLELGLGYRYVAFHSRNTARDENRIRQQFVFSRGPFTARFRIDERFHPDGDEIGFRIRPLVRYNHRLNQRGLAAFVSHESFFLPNSTSWGQRRGYERMRNIVGLTLPLGEAMSADVGYLNQFRPEQGTTRAQMEHAVSVQLTINFDSVVHARADD